MAPRKRKAGSITSGYLEKEGKRSELDLYVLHRAGSETHDLDYLCPLPHQNSEHSYFSLRC